MAFFLTLLVLMVSLFLRVTTRRRRVFSEAPAIGIDLGTTQSSVSFWNLERSFAKVDFTCFICFVVFLFVDCLFVLF